MRTPQTESESDRCPGEPSLKPEGVINAFGEEKDKGGGMNGKSGFHGRAQEKGSVRPRENCGKEKLSVIRTGPDKFLWGKVLLKKTRVGEEEERVPNLTNTPWALILVRK